MKFTSLLIVLILSPVIIAGCGKEPEKQAVAEKQQALRQTAEQTTQQTIQGVLGKVVEKINDGEGYTFLLIDSGKEKFWIATPEFQVSVGKMVVVPEGTRMTNFHSKPLKRDFDAVMFVDAVIPVPSDQTTAPMPASATTAVAR